VRLFSRRVWKDCAKRVFQNDPHRLAVEGVGFDKLIGEDKAGTLAALWKIRERIVNPVLAEVMRQRADLSQRARARRASSRAISARQPQMWQPTIAAVVQSLNGSGNPMQDQT
jgi:hypothetical protein